MPLTPRQQKLAAVFSEWARRYAEDPEAFAPILDESGQPVADYGENCAVYFEAIESELFPAAADAAEAPTS